jgi:prepilin-type N-terminal cleavage/methylation domain-containing protein
MKVKKGFTLVELLIALALVSLIIVTGTNPLLIGIKAHAITIDEFNVQSNTRYVSAKINTIIRDASGVFVLHREDDENLTEEWNYIMLNEDSTKLLEYVWDDVSKTHIPRELVVGINDVTFDLEFIKNNPPDKDKLLEFNLNVKTGGIVREIKSELESKNALQVIDRSYMNKGNTLAYRYDARLDEASNAQAVIAMVLDTSGSMAYNMNGNSTTNNSNKRITKMKAEAVRLVESLAKNNNIYISIVPFSSTANNPKEMLKANSNLSTIRNQINGLSADGGTNTGDGIRRGFYKIKYFNEEDENKNKTNKNFMIVLVDGVTTFASVNMVNEQVSTPTYQGSEYILDGHVYKYDTYSSRTVKIDYGDTYNDGTYEYSKYRHRSRDLGETRISGALRTEPFIQNNTEYFYSRTSGSRYYYRSYEHEYRRYIYEYDGVKPGDYVTGDNNIDNNKANDNTYYSNGRYAGNGSNLDPWGTEYVNVIGEMVREYKEGTNEAIKVYVIGFSAVPKDHNSLGDIAMATRGDKVFYEAGDSDALEEIFRAIQMEITDALWHIGGPN